MQRGNSLASRDVASHLHPFTNLQQHETDGPLVIERGEGVYLYDDAGKRYLEGMAGLWCTSLGYSQERLAAAAYRQLQKLPFDHAFRGRTHEVTVELAEKLLSLSPSPMSKVFFANSGSEANDSAIKLVWYYNNALGRPERRKIIGRHKGYHGTTIATASLTGLPDFHRDFNLPLPWVVHAECPDHWRSARPGETEAAYAERLAADLEALILAEGPETVAAFIAEPVMGVGAVIVPPAGYFERVQAVLRKYDILFIVDEVVCGFGRTGSMWGSQTFGIRPDILTAAKALSSAYLPISAVMITEPIYRTMVAQSEKLGQFAHGFTYSGHPACAAVALETLRIYEERDIVGHVRRVGPRLQAGLGELAKRPIVGQARSVGLMGAIELVADKRGRTPFPPALCVGAHLTARAQEHGLFVRAIGDAVVMAPPLIITEAEVDELLKCLAHALDETEAAFASAMTMAAGS